MKKYNEALGLWTIGLEDKDSRNGIRKKNSIRDVQKRVKTLIEVLKILERNELFFLESMEAYYLNPPERTSFKNVTDKFKLLMDDSVCNERLNYLRLDGKTNIGISNKLEERLIAVHLSLGTYDINLSVGVYSDFVLPLKDENEYQIDLAIINSNRLERCLNEIKEAKFGNYIFPDKGIYWGDAYPIYGFRIYLSDPISEEEDFPEKREIDVEIFSNLTDEQILSGMKNAAEFFENKKNKAYPIVFN